MLLKNIGLLDVPADKEVIYDIKVIYNVLKKSIRKKYVFLVKMFA